MKKSDVCEWLKKFTSSDGVLYVPIKALPNAPKTEAVEMLNLPDDEQVLKVKVAAVPEKGKANKEICLYFANLLGVSKSQVSVVQGATSQRKIVKVQGVSFT